MEGLVQWSANDVPLSPISFLERAAIAHEDKVSIVFGTMRFTWRETHERCRKLASALVRLEISRGDIVVALAPNIPALYELHFGVPMAGAVLSTLNIKLDEAMLAMKLEQLKAKIIFVDYQLIEVVKKALDILSRNYGNPPLLVLIRECDQATPSMANIPPSISLDYNGLLAMGRVDFEIIRPNNECDPISVNYTSGSTGNPKGAVYSHRAAYLNSLAQIFRCDMRQAPVFLWTVDMFRCNGWCLTWAIAALGGTNICLRNVSAKIIFDSIFLHKVTHFCGQPTILNIIANAPSSDQIPLPFKVNVIIAGVLPMSQVVSKVEDLGFNVNHAYGMTEVLGPAIVRPWKHDHNSSPLDEHEMIKCCEGLHNLIIEGVDVKDPVTMKSVPHDGTSIGEIMFRGNPLMLGYFKNPKATEKAFRDGWYLTGDLGIRHPNGHIQMKDRVKDIIISEGEIISTLEVESVLLRHPQVLEAAVVGKHDDQIGETPWAFVKLKEGSDASDQEIIKFCGDQLPHNMVPKTIVFGDLPLNSTGKVQKFVLREKANAECSLAL